MLTYHNLSRRSHASFGLIVGLALIVSGCGAVDVPFGGSDGVSTPDLLATGSVVDNGVTDVAAEDWKTVQDTISISFSTLADGSAKEWNNENTGSNGSIVPDQITTNEQGMLCRPFQTRLDTISGVENFDGYACKQRNGSWRITKVAPATGPNDG